MIASSSAPVAGRTRGILDHVGRLRVGVFLASLAVCLFAVFVVWRHQTLVTVEGDAYKFSDLGRNIAEGRCFCYTDGPPTIRRAPMYPAFIALLDLTFRTTSPWLIQLAQCFLGAGTSLLAFEIGRRVFSVRTGLIAGLVVLLHPMVVRYVPDLQVETFLTFLYTLTVYRAVRMCEEGTAWNGFLLGLFGAMGAMVKAVVLPFPVLFAIGYLYWRHRTRSSPRPLFPGWIPVAATAGAMALVVLPWTFRNYEVTGGRFVLVSGNASGEFLRGYVFAQPRYYLLRDPPYEVGENEANEMQRDLFRKQGLVWAENEEETERVQNEAAKRKFKSDPAAFVKKFVIGIAAFWYVVTTRRNSLLVGALALVGWGFAAYGLWTGRGKGYRYWVVLLPIVTLNVFYAAVLALGRYSAPCIPALMVLTAFGVDSLLRRWVPGSLALSPSDPNIGGHGRVT